MCVCVCLYRLGWVMAWSCNYAPCQKDSQKGAPNLRNLHTLLMAGVFHVPAHGLRRKVKGAKAVPENSCAATSPVEGTLASPLIPHPPAPQRMTISSLVLFCTVYFVIGKASVALCISGRVFYSQGGDHIVPGL